MIFVLIATTIYLFLQKNISNTVDYNFSRNSLWRITITGSILCVTEYKDLFNYNISKIEIDDGARLLIVLEVSYNEVENISKFSDSIKAKYDNSKISYFENKLLPKFRVKKVTTLLKIIELN